MSDCYGHRWRRRADTRLKANPLCGGVAHPKVVAFCVVAAIAVALVLVFYHGRYVRAHKLLVEIDSLGKLLVLFVEDHGRMPADMDELYRRKYLVIGKSGYPTPGPATKDRSLRPGPMCYQDLDAIRIGFSTGEPSARPLQVGPNKEYARDLVESWCARIWNALEEARIRRCQHDDSPSQ